MGSSSSRTTEATEESQRPLAANASIEDLVSKEWERVLGLREGSVQASDNFLELGGESLLALRVCSALQYLFGDDSSIPSDGDPQFGMVVGPFAIPSLLSSASLAAYCNHLRQGGCKCAKRAEPSEGEPSSKRTLARQAPVAEPLSPSIREAARKSTSQELAALLSRMDASDALQHCAVASRGSKCFTAMHAAAQAGSEECLKLLLEMRARPTVVEAGASMTPSHYAAMNSAPCLKLLLDARAPLTLRDVRGQSLVHAAARAGNADSLDVLVHALAQSSSENGAEMQTRALRHNQGRFGLLEWSDRWARTAVHWAALNGHESALSTLLAANASPEPPLITAHQMGKRTHLTQESPLALAIRIHGESSAPAQILEHAIATRNTHNESTSEGQIPNNQKYRDGIGDLVSSYLVTIAEPRLDRLAIWELKERLQASVKRLQCRVFFETAAPPASFFGLKAAEKVCAVLLYASATELSEIAEKAREANHDAEVAQVLLQKSAWLSGLALWQRFHAISSDSELDLPLTFKVTCRRKGNRFANVSSQRLAVSLASALQAAHGWSAKVRRPDFEVRVLLGDAELLVDIPLLFQPAMRIGGGEICEAGLSAPVAWAMSRTAKLLPGETVLDPMCGKAIVLVEAALSWPSCQYIGFDIDGDQLRGAMRNVDMLAGSSKRVDLFHGDARRIPVPDGSIDAIVCDIPFGRQYSTIEECRDGFYAALLAEFDRVVHRETGRMVLLSSQEQEPWVLKAAGFGLDEGYSSLAWTCTGRRKTPLGFLDAVILSFCRPSASAGDGSVRSMSQLPELSDRLDWETSSGRGDWASLKVNQRPPMQLARGREI